MKALPKVLVVARREGGSLSGKVFLRFYSTSEGISILAGAVGINGSPLFSAQINAELNANSLLLPSFRLGIGPLVSLRIASQGLTVLPGCRHLPLRAGLTTLTRGVSMAQSAS